MTISAEQRLANLAENPYAGQGAVLLDIGGDIGAIVVQAEADLEGVEIEIAPHGTHRQHDHHLSAHHDGHGHLHSHDHTASHTHHHPHVAVVGRPAGGRVRYSAVFPGLRDGRYDLAEAGGTVRLTVDVTGGRVTEAVWPTVS